MYSVHKTDIINIAAKQVRKQNLVVFYLRDCPGKRNVIKICFLFVCLANFVVSTIEVKPYLVRDSENGTARRGTLSHFNVLAIC